MQRVWQSQTLSGGAPTRECAPTSRNRFATSPHARSRGYPSYGGDGGVWAGVFGFVSTSDLVSVAPRCSLWGQSGLAARLRSHVRAYSVARAGAAFCRGTDCTLPLHCDCGGRLALSIYISPLGSRIGTRFWANFGEVMHIFGWSGREWESGHQA